MRVREHLSYRTFVLDLFLGLHFMSDETADTVATMLSRLTADLDSETGARTNSQSKSEPECMAAGPFNPKPTCASSNTKVGPVNPRIHS
jgi:hypothetical protein